MKTITQDRIETTYIMGRSGRDASTYARTLDVLAEFLQHVAPGDYWIRRRLWRLVDDEARANVQVVEEADWGVANVLGEGAFTLRSLAHADRCATYDDHDDAAFRRRLAGLNSTFPGPGRDA